MSAIACCHEGCGASVCFTPEIETRLRSTHETWMCPFGHSQYFAKDSPKDAEVRRMQESRDMWRGYYEEAMEVFGTCPFGCGWRSSSGIANRWMSMLRHFETAHQAMAEGTPALTLYFESRREAAA